MSMYQKRRHFIFSCFFLITRYYRNGERVGKGKRKKKKKTETAVYVYKKVYKYNLYQREKGGRERGKERK
jgi:hypothetical protein